ncbi:hypothetical protein [Flavobacterium foetidum]|uniref:hypothetical protein n=1 Tax=Flavobacterium foetidum TaxID=2026681 RepID=UPI001074EC72|nr:hypothetical protein [Flavobacterium foetidum]KAF2511848.1 hypothetical protein E0W73_16095 [Flavobacterium foetidum]
MTQILRSFALLFATFFSHQITAQATGNFIKGSIGFGLTTPHHNEENLENISGFGFYANAEYVMGLTKWFSIRPYAGAVFTSTHDDVIKNPEQYKAETNAFFLGGKVRVCAPIPWFAAYLETGIGASIGSFKTYTYHINEKKNGITPHIPISFGLALGRKNKFDIAYSFYSSLAVKQSFGAISAGYSFPLHR